MRCQGALARQQRMNIRKERFLKDMRQHCAHGSKRMRPNRLHLPLSTDQLQSKEWGHARNGQYGYVACKDCDFGRFRIHWFGADVRPLEKGSPGSNRGSESQLIISGTLVPV